jgi:signal transduction histidine kinase
MSTGPARPWQNPSNTSWSPGRGPGTREGAIYIRESFPTFRLQWRFWREIILAGVLISSLFGFLLSRSLSRPVQSMAAVAEALAAGDLSQRITYRSPDELGQLAEKFNLMADRIQELVDTLSEERDQLQEVLRQLQESERRRDELVANVSHELRTPLACIQGCVEALVDGVAATPDRQQECLSTITEELHYLSRLVNDLLNLARASLGQLDMEIQPCDLREVARQTMAKFQPQAERQGVALEITDPPDLPPAQADPGRIAQVLTNLLDNALRHTPPGGRIHLTLAGQGDHVFVTVEDTGTGIPREELPAVFERFYRADRSRNRETGGSGLGLAIVREIVHAHGGDVWIESELGQGTKIGFRLPLVPISTTS